MKRAFKPKFGARFLALAAAWALLGAAPMLTGCGWSRAADGKAAWSVEGKWRSKKGMVLTARLLPDGTLEMTDPRGIKHPFRRVGPERWEARISRVARGSIHREGDQLVFRREPTEEAKKPLAEKDGIVLMRQIRPAEDRMTRVTDTEAAPKKP
jgi:hypothetical protein